MIGYLCGDALLEIHFPNSSISVLVPKPPLRKVISHHYVLKNNPTLLFYPQAVFVGDTIVDLVTVRKDWSTRAIAHSSGPYRIKSIENIAADYLVRTGKVRVCYV